MFISAPKDHNETNSKMEKAEKPLSCKDFRQKKKFDSFRYSRIKTIELIWSEWGDSNSRRLDPKSSALPTGPHPDIELIIFREVVKYVVKIGFAGDLRKEEIGISLELQGFLGCDFGW